MKHYTKEELELYRHGELSVLGRIACSAHLRQCKQCQLRMAELKEDDALIRDLQASIRLFQEFSKAPPARRSRTKSGSSKG